QPDRVWLGLPLRIAVACPGHSRVDAPGWSVQVPAQFGHRPGPRPAEPDKEYGINFSAHVNFSTKKSAEPKLRALDLAIAVRAY
ncbi:MAG: hypothetical protein QF541_15355, partial [Lentisphaeria bacterium]|nr:hypothetical protein [Lentisphaeria bacterium]